MPEWHTCSVNYRRLKRRLLRPRMSYCPTLSPRGNGHRVYPPVPHWHAVPGLELVLFQALVFTPGANPDNSR